MNVSKMSREKIAAALAKGGRYMNHARQWVAVKVGERVNPDDIALALVSPDALIVREAVRMASKAGRGAKRAAGAVARKVRKNPTGTGAAAVGERGGWSIVKPEKRDDAGGVLAWGPSGMLEDSEGRLYPFRWALVPLARIIPSNDPKTGRPLRFYLPELQGRNREAVASRSQVQKLAAGLDARRLMLASSTPADSAPVVWRGTGERSEVFLVVSGNGRTMAAILAFGTESEAWEQYLSAVASRAAVSAVAMAPGGFWRAWRDAGFDPANLSPEWLRKRDAFAARSVAQIRDAGETIRRDLALRVWAIHPAAALAKLRSEKGLRQAN